MSGTKNYPLGKLLSQHLLALPPFAELLTILQRDKKVRAGKIHFILLQAIGQAVKTAGLTTIDLDNYWRELNYA